VTIERLATDRRIESQDILNVNPAFGETNPDGDWTGASVLFPGDLLIFPTTKITEANIRHRLGVDRPLLTQYFDYLWDTVRLDFGTSFQTNEDSLTQVARFLPRTIQLGVFSLIIALVFSIPIGIISAIRQDGWMDYVLRGFAILSLAAPVFWTATMLIFVVTPGGVFGGGVFAIPFTDVDARNIWDSPGGFFRLYGIPALAGGLAAGAGLMRITRSALLEVLRQDYLRTAWAKGLRERTVITRHAMKNAMIPVLSVLGLQMAALLGGTVVLEVLFTIPGMGQFLLTRIIQQDIPPIQTIVLIFAIFTIAVNLIIDLSYAVVDPRIRYS
jgi:peptide/nickel transport system permease protein